MKIAAATVLIVGLSLGGCAHREVFTAKFEGQRAPTSAEKAAIIERVKGSYYDPYSLRDIEISMATPVQNATGAAASDVIVCMRALGKNRFGAYAGRQHSAFRLNAEGKVMALARGEGFCSSPQIHYMPFPELSRLMKS